MQGVWPRKCWESWRKWNIANCHLWWLLFSPSFLTMVHVNTLRSTPTSSKDSANRCWNTLIASLLSFATVLGVIDTFWGCYNLEAYHTLILSGEQWVEDMAAGHQDKLKDNLGINKHVFCQLRKEFVEKGGLRARQYVGIWQVSCSKILYDANKGFWTVML